MERDDLAVIYFRDLRFRDFKIQDEIGTGFAPVGPKSLAEPS